MYTVRSPLAECETLKEAILIKHLLNIRYDFDSAIFDQDDYLVPQTAQCVVMQDVYDSCRVRNPV